MPQQCQNFDYQKEVIDNRSRAWVAEFVRKISSHSAELLSDNTLFNERVISTIEDPVGYIDEVTCHLLGDAA